MAYKIKITAESNGTIVIGIIFKILIPDFCIFILPLCAESKRRFGCCYWFNVLWARVGNILYCGD